MLTDDRFFNPTPFAGLENNILNCYANPLLQLLFFTACVRNLALRHAAGPCRDPACLPCELGYVFDMLQKSEGQIIPTRLGNPANTPPTMFEIAPKLDTLSLGGHALELNFALPWKQIRSFEGNYIDPIDVLSVLPRMPGLTDLKLGREPPEHTPGPTQGIMITLASLRALTLNVSDDQRSPGHPDDLLDHLTLPALSDLEVECDVEESIECMRRLIERSDCRIETLTLVVTFKCRGDLLSLFRLTPHLRRLTLFDGTTMTAPRLLDALVVRPEDPGSVLLPKMDHTTLLASSPLPEEDVLRWLDVFESRVNPPQPQSENGEVNEAQRIHSLRGILMGCTSGENIVGNRVCVDRFQGIATAGVTVDLWYGPDLF